MIENETIKDRASFNPIGTQEWMSRTLAQVGKMDWHLML
jgi:hypothetical protein